MMMLGYNTDRQTNTKVYALNSSRKDFSKTLKVLYSGICNTVKDLKIKFVINELKRNQADLTIEKTIKKKGDKLVLVIAWFRVQLTLNLMSANLRVS